MLYKTLQRWISAATQQASADVEYAFVAAMLRLLASSVTANDLKEHTEVAVFKTIKTLRKKDPRATQEAKRAASLFIERAKELLNPADPPPPAPGKRSGSAKLKKRKSADTRPGERRQPSPSSNFSPAATDRRRKHSHDPAVGGLKAPAAAAAPRRSQKKRPASRPRSAPPPRGNSSGGQVAGRPQSAPMPRHPSGSSGSGSGSGDDDGDDGCGSDDCGADLLCSSASGASGGGASDDSYDDAWNHAQNVQRGYGSWPKSRAPPLPGPATEWACACTFVNGAKSLACGVCGKSRPRSGARRGGQQVSNSGPAASRGTVPLGAGWQNVLEQERLLAFVAEGKNLKGRRVVAHDYNYVRRPATVKEFNKTQFGEPHVQLFFEADGSDYECEDWYPVSDPRIDWDDAGPQPQAPTRAAPDSPAAAQAHTHRRTLGALDGNRPDLWQSGGAKDAASKHVFEVERILKQKRTSKGQVKYLIRWQGFTATEDSWEPEENIKAGSPDLLDQFLADRVEQS